MRRPESNKRKISRFIKKGKQPGRIRDWCIIDDEKDKVTIDVEKLLAVIGVANNKVNHAHATEVLANYFEQNNIDLK